MSTDENMFKRSRYLSTVHSRTVELERFRVHYLAEGYGAKPLILIHGGGVWLYTFRHTIRELSAHFSVYAMDMPGYGYTMPLFEDQQYGLETSASFILEFLDRLGIDRASFLGHSWGGGWLLHFAALHPERVQSLILVDSSGLKVKDVFEWELLKIPVLNTLLMKILTLSAVEKRIRHSFYNKDVVTREMAEEIYLPLTFRHNRKAQLKTACSQDWTVTERALPDIHKPVLILWGEQDLYLDVGLAHRFTTLLPDSENHIFPQCGHSPLEECPRQANALITRFIHKHG